MKKSFVLLLLIALNTFGLMAQSFEGKIVYATSFKPAVDDLPVTFETMMGSRMEYFVKGGDYKSTTNGTLVNWQLYRSAENKYYTRLTNAETIYWSDGAENKDSVFSATINKGVVTILGYLCDELILNCKSGSQKYYFSSELGMDPKLFEQYKYGNWYEYISRAKALPLKYIIETEQFTMESVATEVIPMKLDSSDFQLPADVKLEKATF